MRIWKGILAAGIAATAVLVGASPAVAGGGTWVFEGQHRNSDPVLVSGERVRATVLLWLKGVVGEKKGAYWAGPQHGPFYAYISPSDPNGPGDYAPPLPKDALLVGEVRWEETKDPGVLEAVLEFTVPELPPGHYVLDHCNDPCTRQIGDTWTTRIKIVGTEDDAFLARSIGHIETRLNTAQPALRIRVRNLTEKLERLTIAVKSMREDLAEREREEVTEAEKEVAPVAQDRPWWPAPVGLALLAGAAIAARSRPFRRRDSAAAVR